MPVSYEDLRREVLQLASEDLMGLWEAWWRADAMYPETALSARLACAERVIRDLLSDRLINLYRRTWRDHSLVPTEETDQVLRDAGSWHPYADQPSVFFLEAR